jgi:hypothetical protein
MVCLWQPSLRAAPCWKKAVALTDVVSIELPKRTPNFVAMDRLLNGRQEKMKPVDVNRWLGSRQAGWRWELACIKTVKTWRRDGDSNPGGALTPTRFPGVRLKPLGHPSQYTSNIKL